MARRLVLVARHKSGAQCVMTFEDQGRRVQGTFSFRDPRGFAPGDVVRWKQGFDRWVAETCQGDMHAALPEGWTI